MIQNRACILDYGSGNVKSVFNVLEFLGYETIISNDIEEIRGSSHLIMPGVGAFGASMAKIFKNIPVDCLIEEIIEKGKPFLGICVGMQILADIGLEFGEHIGLGLIPGVVDKVHSDGQQLPHVGWNNIEINKDSPLFANFGEFRDFYFVHSYAYSVANEEHLIAQVEYGSKFTAAICKDNIYGVQFHPEKSQRAGQLLLHNFLSNT